jgi:FkbM family methyltransferase
MVSWQGFIRTVSIIKNPFVVFNLKLRKKSAIVTFPNGAAFHVTWPQFVHLRDGYDFVKKYQLQQISDDTFKTTINKCPVVGSSILGPTLGEIESGIYEYDYRDKIVLDIGGFEGESAVFFWSKGAKKVVVYEPVVRHLRFIYENIRLNKMNAEVHSEGIGDRDDEITVAYDTTNAAFGFELKNAPNKMNIKIKDVSRVVLESGADVAKIDCEGAEISLVNVPKEILRKLEYVIVELHSPQIRQQLFEKFKDSGFVVCKDHYICEGVTLVHFKRTSIPD